MIGRDTRRSSWMLTFADMLSILLCFVVLAYALRTVPDGAREQALSAIREVFRPGSGSPSGVEVPPASPRGGNYWATWLGLRVGKIPSLTGQRIEAHGAKASLALSDTAQSDGAAVLTNAELAALAAVLNASGAQVTVRASAKTATADDWARAGRRAQEMSDRLVEAGLRHEPRIVVSGAGVPLAVEIGREEP